jgi:hypothetical protein
MNRGTKQNPNTPPFNMDKVYECFNEHAMPAKGWTEEERLAGRLNELMIPEPLYPLTTIGLQQGKMLITWDNGDSMGFALHHNV